MLLGWQFLSIEQMENVRREVGLPEFLTTNCLTYLYLRRNKPASRICLRFTGSRVYTSVNGYPQHCIPKETWVF